MADSFDLDAFLFSTQKVEWEDSPVPAPAPAPVLSIRVNAPNVTGRRVEFRQEVLTLGRHRDADLSILDLAASRQHAMLQHLPSGFWELIDLGSNNGTRINGEHVQRTRVFPGDVIRIGETLVTVDYEAPSQPDQAPQPPFRAYKGDDPYIFVGYGHEDRVAVFSEIARLHRSGYRIWYDEGIHPGSAWADSIGKILQKASFFLAFVSKSSAASKNCEDEIFFAVDEAIPWVLVHLEPTQMQPGLRLRTARVQAIHRHDMDERRYHQLLAETLPSKTRWPCSSEPVDDTRAGSEPLDPTDSPG